MSLFDKVKAGMSEAGQKAKILVEQNKIKLANVSKQAQIDKLHKEIGAKMSQFYIQGKSFTEQDFQSELEKIAILRIEIEQNEQEIAQLADEKPCKSCGKDNIISARICHYCKQAFEIIDMNHTNLNRKLEEKNEYR